MSQSELQTELQALAVALSGKVFGQEEVIEQVVLTVACAGHALLTGAPGVAKTTLVRNLASALGCGYRRIQFTPDLTPFDIMGGETLQFDERNPDSRRLGFSPGPIFTSFVLADEINRASPRTQSALLEAMQERQVSIGGVTHKLPHPFFVFATQNPIENEGTFPLPEAQLDRFLLDINVPYPDEVAEFKVALLPGGSSDLEPLRSTHISNSRSIVEKINMSKALTEAAVRIVRNTRPETTALNFVKKYLDFGASPRASQALVIASKALALLQGSDEVKPEHLMRVGASVLRHRCVLNFKSVTEKKSADEIVTQVIQETIV